MDKASKTNKMQRRKLELIFNRHGYGDYKWIDSKSIVVSQWVRMKCIFGCKSYGKSGACPPKVPSVSECRAFFREFKTGVIFHFAKRVVKPEDRFAWTRKINLKLLELERDLFLSGYHKAFLLFMDSCNLCASCTGGKGECKNPKLSRPTPEGMAVDVFATVRKIRFPIEVLSDYSQAMNRYAFLLVE
jgi:predicted metal-binding protein